VEGPEPPPQSAPGPSEPLAENAVADSSQPAAKHAPSAETVQPAVPGGSAAAAEPDDGDGDDEEYELGPGLLPLRLLPPGWRRNLLIGGTAAATVVVALSELTSAWVVIVLPLLVTAVVAYVEVLDRVICPDDAADLWLDDDEGSGSEPPYDGRGTPQDRSATSEGHRTNAGTGSAAGEAPQ
jgi:hypothetical protein